MVFQSYALFPNMTVADNVGYGLRVRGMAEAARTARVRQMLELVQLRGPGRTPHLRSFPAASASDGAGALPWPSSRACCCWTNP